MAVAQAEFWTEVFLRPTGLPYAGVKVSHYAAGTSTPKTVWVDGPMATPAAQPVLGDNNGRVSFYGDGDYRLVIADANGTTLYDWDNIKLTAKAATLRGENQAVSYPAATSVNRGQLFAKIDGSGNVVDLGIQKDTAFASVVFANSTPSGTINFAKGADLASGSTLNIGTDGNFFDVIGGVDIATLGVRAAGTLIWLRFTQALNLLYDATNLILPYGVAYRTVPNEIIAFASLGSGHWVLAWRSGPTTAPGTIGMTGAIGPDDGHVLCDGATLLTATNPGLFAKIGTTYGAGAGDGASFSAPDLRGRSPIGVGSGGTGSGASGVGKPTGGLALSTVARAQWKGEENHLLTTTETPVTPHSHGVTDPGHAHLQDPRTATTGTGSAWSGAGGLEPLGGVTDSSATGLTVNTSAAVLAGSAHNVIQPVMGVTFQVRV